MDSYTTYEVLKELAPRLTTIHSPLLHEYQSIQRLYNLQPAGARRLIESQAQLIANAVHLSQLQVKFQLPDQVVIESAGSAQASLVQVPVAQRQQLVGGVANRLTRVNLRDRLRQRLAELEDVRDASISVSASLIRYRTAFHMVHHMLPSGQTVVYTAADHDDIPTFPSNGRERLKSSITGAGDAIAEEYGANTELDRGTLQSPFVPAAQRFYLPQWVIFDDQGKLLVTSVNQAQQHLSSMQSFINLLHTAISLAPYMVADTEYQQKRYGMLGQLVHQGRALAIFETDEMITALQRRAAAHDLNRGLSLSMPYFDDQTLEMRNHNFEVIPTGRIMFIPAFVVRAARQEIAKVAQDTRFSPTTRKYLLMELHALEKAFLKPNHA